MEEEGQAIEAFWPHQAPAALPSASSSSSSRYERLGKIGEGAFGEVAAGLDRLTGRAVAIKSVRLGGDFEKGAAHVFRFFLSGSMDCQTDSRLDPPTHINQ